MNFVESPPLAIEPPEDMPVYFATLIAGLEPLVADEISERLRGAKMLGVLRGKVVFATREPPEAALELGTIEHLFAYAGQLEGLPTSRDGLEVIDRELEALDLGEPLALFHRLHCAPEDPSFRITAQRAGTHDYNSLEIAAAAGAGVNRRYGWRVDLTQYDYDVRVYVTDESALIGLRLSPEALHRRARVQHAAASLNPTVAHAMCRLAQPSAGQVFVDPMCGAGTILVERAALGEVGLLIGGELHGGPLSAARTNLAAAELQASLARWDARRLPLWRESVDAVVCNLPWGRRIGSHRSNQHLYPGFIRELGRVLRPGGVAVLLTQEKRLLTRLLAKGRKLAITAQYPLSLSGTHPTIYVLTRTAD